MVRGKGKYFGEYCCLWGVVEFLGECEICGEYNIRFKIVIVIIVV